MASTQRSWSAGRKLRQASNRTTAAQRRASRRAAQQSRHQRNVGLREQGIPTPWERAKAARRLHR